MDEKDTNTQPQNTNAEASETPKQPEQPAQGATPPEQAQEVPDGGAEALLPPEQGGGESGISDKQLAANRENAKKGGRPKGTVSEATRRKMLVRQILEKRIEAELEELLAAKFDLAKGHFVYITKVDEATGKEIIQRVYKKAPDGKSLEYLLDQVIGKPTQPIGMVEPPSTDDIELTEEEESKIAYVLKNLGSYQAKRAANAKPAGDGSGAVPSPDGNPDQKQGN